MNTESPLSFHVSDLVTKPGPEMFARPSCSVNAPACRELSTEGVVRRECSKSLPLSDGRFTVYVVDDDESLTDLYTILLQAAGCDVKAFHDRSHALASLEEDVVQPHLLITDYRGRSITVDDFMQRCRIAHPRLRILMASGFDPDDLDLRIKPDHFFPKPFTPGEFYQAVMVALGTFDAARVI